MGQWSTPLPPHHTAEQQPSTTSGLEWFLDQSSDVFVAYDRNLRYAFVNKIAADLLGLPPEQMIGKTNEDLFGEQGQSLTMYVEQAFQTGEKVFALHDVPTRTGIKSYDTIYTPVRDASGDIVRVVGVCRDVTEKKQHIEHVEESLLRRDAILESVGFAARQFLRFTSLEQSIQKVLERLGKATGVSRVYIFENETTTDGLLVTNQHYEWAAPGTRPEIDNPDLQGVPYYLAGLGRWADTMQQGQAIHGLVHTFPHAERDVLEPQGIISLAAVPIFVGKQWWGFIGFDDCETNRAWSLPEIETLKAAASLLGAAIHRNDVQDALRQSEERYRSLVDNIKDIIFQTDADGRWTFLNPAWREVTGYPIEESLGKPFFSYVHPDDRAHNLAMFRPLVEREKDHCQHEVRYLTSNGEERWLEVYARLILDHEGTMLGTSGILKDITERVRANETLVRIRAAVESTSDAISIGDMQGRLLYHNRAFVERYGYTPEQLNEAGGPAAIFVNPDIGHEVVIKAMSGNSWSGIVDFCTRDGRIIPTLLRGDIIVDQGGNYVGLIAVCTDVTMQKKAEQELIAAREAALEASRLKSEFLANMSHEIRTPLNAIIGMTGLLLDMDLSADQKEFAETIRNSGDALLTVINDILDFSKIEAGKLDLEYQPFDLRECIEESLDLIAPQAAEKQLELAYSMSDDTPCMLRGDVTRLRQVLINLLSNAVKFTRQGEIVVNVTSKPHNPMCQVDPAQSRLSPTLLPPPLPEESRGFSSGEQTMPGGAEHGELYEIHFAVRDTGIGIPSNRMNRLFASFSQVDSSVTRKYGGTGLGLAISKALIEAMGGSISVESEVDRGTTFHFTIIASATPAQPRVFLRDEHPHLEGRRVLIVDDNETNLRILSLQVQSWGMHPRATTSGEDALNWIRWGEPFDIAILDMQMPDMDGVTLAEEIRAHRAPAVLPLMMLTSVGGMRGINTERAQFVASLSKPVKPSHLHNVLLNIFAGQDVSLKEQTLSTRDSEPPLPAHPLHILVAEDHAVNQRVALRLLKRLGYRADVAANGVEVLDALKRQSYDLILMDVQMPEMDGEETTRTIRANLPAEQQPHIVAVTAHALKGSREQYLAAGMDDYLSKPVRLEELATVLRACQSLTERKREQEREREQKREQGKALAPGTADSISPPLDPQIVAELLDCDGEEECDEIRDIIELFLESTPDLLQELHEGLARSDPKRFRQAAHTLKSSSQLGAMLLSHLAARLQDMGDVGNLEPAGPVLAQAEAEYRRVQDALRAILSNLKP